MYSRLIKAPMAKAYFVYGGNRRMHEGKIEIVAAVVNLCHRASTRRFNPLEIEINPLDSNPRYPNNPQTLGEKLKKARMDRGMRLNEVAALFGISDTAVFNWEIRGKIPEENRIKIGQEFIEGKPNTEINFKQRNPYPSFCIESLLRGVLFLSVLNRTNPQ